MLDYFTYLRMCSLQDTKENFIDYLIEVNGENYENAKKMAEIMYRGENRK